MHFSPRYLAIKLLEKDREVEDIVKNSPDHKAIFMLRDQELARIENITGEDITSIIASEKYGFIAGALAETFTDSTKHEAKTTQLIDAFVTNKLFGFPIFLAIMLFIFWCTFEIGSYPMGWIESLVDWIAGMVNRLMPEGPLKDLIADGIIGGVGGVIVFLPNILILYFFISFMEDSGYMARAAFIMDKLMHKIGLHGKSFIPLVMDSDVTFGDNVGSRNREQEQPHNNDTDKPLHVVFGTTSVYVLLVGTFFSRYASFVFLGLYLLGIIVAVITARLLRRFWFKTDETPFVMELPPYRLPTFKSSLRHMWGKGEQYLKKMGGIILVASIVVWALNYFPLRNEESSTPEAVAAMDGDDSKIDIKHDSYLEMLGKAVNPVMEPIGFHWRTTVAAIAALRQRRLWFPLSECFILVTRR